MEQKRAVSRKLAAKYRGCTSRKERSSILEQVVELTGYHRKYAAWLLRNIGKRRLVRGPKGELTLMVVGHKRKRRATPRVKTYGEAVKKEVVYLWEIFGMCGKRLKAAMPDLVPKLIERKRFDSGDEREKKLLLISAATIDRLLKQDRAKLKGTSHTKPSSMLKASIPIVVSSELNTTDPGHYQIDLVGHDGGNPNGQFAFSLNAMELSSGWIEPRVLLNKAQRWTREAIQSIRAEAAVGIRSLHSDNDTAFINERLQRWCAEQKIQYARGRPYHSNDTCYIEQKNYDIVRQAVGYFRYESEEEVELIGQLYEQLRLLVNFFYPSSRLVEKVREGSRIRRRYDRPQSPFRRLVANEAVPGEVKLKLHHCKARLDPFSLRAGVSEIQERLIELQKRKGTAILYPGPAYPQARQWMRQRLFG